MSQPKNQSNKKFSDSNSTIESLSNAYREISPYLNIGYFFLAAIALFSWGGYKLDEKQGTAPVFTVLGAVLGIITGFYNFFKTVSNASSKHKQEK